MQRNKLQENLAKLHPAKQLLNNPLLGKTKSGKLNKICLDMTKAVGFQGFESVYTAISQIRAKETSDRDFFMQVLELIEEIAELNDDIVLQTIVDATQRELSTPNNSNVWNQPEHQQFSNYKNREVIEAKPNFYTRPVITNNKDSMAHYWEENKQVDKALPVVDLKPDKKTPADEPNKEDTEQDWNFEKAEDWGSPEDPDWQDIVEKNKKVKADYDENHEKIYMSIDDIMDKDYANTEIKNPISISIKPKNDNPNYKVYLFDSFTPEEDVNTALKYLNNSPVIGLDTEFTREKGAVYI